MWIGLPQLSFVLKHKIPKDVCLISSQCFVQSRSCLLVEHSPLHRLPCLSLLSSLHTSMAVHQVCLLSHQVFIIGCAIPLLWMHMSFHLYLFHVQSLYVNTETFWGEPLSPLPPEREYASLPTSFLPCIPPAFAVFAPFARVVLCWWLVSLKSSSFN